MFASKLLKRIPGSCVWCVAVIGLTAAVCQSAHATAPEVVYESAFTNLTAAHPEDIAAGPDGSAYILTSRPGNNYATGVVKLDPAGDLVWTQMFDGSSHDIPGGIAVDAAGDVYLVGTTGSADFPLLNPLQDTPSSTQYETFVMKLSGVDGALLYSTYLGGVRSDWGNDIAVNADGEMYIAGSTESLDFPVVDPLQGELAGYPYFGWSDAYVAKISADGSTLLYSTFFGGTYDDVARGIALDTDGRIHIAGHTHSEDFPTVNPVQVANGGDRDAFAARFSADGSSVEYSTYLGGEEGESVYGLALDGAGRPFAVDPIPHHAGSIPGGFRWRDPWL